MLTNEEIKKKIDDNNKLIEELLTPSEFTLNKQIDKLLKENSELQDLCEHEYEQGSCKFCYKKETN